MRICDIEDCGRKHEGHGLCQYHYQQWYRENNPDSYMRWNKKNKAYQSAWKKQWREENREKHLTDLKIWRAANPESVAAYCDQRRQSLSVSMSDQDKKDSLAWRKLIKDDPCFYCGEYEDLMHYDHIQPLSKGGSDHSWNIVRACRTHNLRKNSKTVGDFLQSEKVRNSG